MHVAFHVSRDVDNSVGIKLPPMPDTELPVLYSFRRCPYAIRARLALQVSQVAYEHREIVLKNKPAHMLALSPKGTVPVLWLAKNDSAHGTHGAQGALVLEQSLDIMCWALAQHDPLGWLPASQADMDAALAWIASNDGAFKQHLDRYKYPHRFQLNTGMEDRDLGCEFLWQINTHLQQQGFLNGPRWGLTDAAVAPFVRQFAHVDPVWFSAQAWSALRVWLENFEKSPGFLRAMQKVAPWQADPCTDQRAFEGALTT
jgi:glutathione S-transferase